MQSEEKIDSTKKGKGEIAGVEIMNSLYSPSASDSSSERSR